jgi:hypothetical protein
VSLWRPEAKTCGLMALLVLALGAVQLGIAPRAVPVAGSRIRPTVLALELSCSPQPGPPLVADPDAVEALRTSTYVDFGFIAAYVLLFAVCGRLHAQRRRPRLGACLAIVGIVAGILDLLENAAMLRLLAGEAACPALWSRPKWGLLFLSLLLVSPLYLERAGKPLRRVLGGMAALTSLIAGAEGVLALVRHSDPLLEAATRRLGEALLLGCTYFLLYAPLRDGLVAALDRLAARPALSWLARWPER